MFLANLIVISTSLIANASRLFIFLARTLAVGCLCSEVGIGWIVGSVYDIYQPDPPRRLLTSQN